eukprot:6623785-Pyramimonas_sp.AAC.1
MNNVGPLVPDRCTADVHSGGRVEYPPVDNDFATVDLAMGVAKRLLGGSRVKLAHAPIMVQPEWTVSRLSPLSGCFVLLNK